MNWINWWKYFHRKSKRPMPQIGLPQLVIPRDALPALCKSLAIFELGESHGQRLVDEIRHSRIRNVDTAYREAVVLFVREEWRHGAVLGRCVDALGGNRLKSTWSESLFVALRRLMG